MNEEEQRQRVEEGRQKSEYRQKVEQHIDNVKDRIFHEVAIPKNELKVGCEYWGFADRDGYCLARWTAEEKFEVPRMKFGHLVLNDHPYPTDATIRDARFFPIRETIYTLAMEKDGT